jgi:MFS transporter, ACS family, hexuronate transporter
MTKYRWTICGLIFFATTVNYIDRQVISLLKSTLSAELNWNDADYTNIEIAFKLFYAIGLMGAGRIIDKLGTKLGYFWATLLWSLAAMGHALVNTVSGFAIARAALGLTEAGNFPAAIKGTAEWFPKKERAFATGIFNSGTNIGAIFAPLTVPFIVQAYGWQWTFIITGAIGFIWLVLWLKYYDEPSKSKYVSAAELDYIQNDPSNFDNAEEKALEDKKIPWTKLLGYKQTWAFAIGKMLTDPIWWFYLFWLPDFMESEYKLKLTGVSLPIALVYLISSVGSVGGGYLPTYFINKGWTAFKSRKTAMFIYACMAVPIFFAQMAGSVNMWLAVIIIGVAAAGHQAWSANIFTTVSDMFPKSSVASVTGIGAMIGSLGGIIFSLFVQKNLFVHYRSIGQIETAYYIMFAICAFAYLLAWIILQIMVPKMEKIKF